jgi:hypothetical protein
MVPPAPARVSTKNCCPKAAVRWSATVRASTSAVPPGANVLTMRTGRCGHSCDPMTMKPAEFDAFVKREMDLNAELVKAAGVQVN